MIETCVFYEDVKDIDDDDNDNDNDNNDEKVKDNNKYDNNNNDISALRLDRDLVFSQGHH